MAKMVAQQQGWFPPAAMVGGHSAYPYFGERVKKGTGHVVLAPGSIVETGAYKKDEKEVLERQIESGLLRSMKDTAVDPLGPADAPPASPPRPAAKPLVSPTEETD